MTGLHPGKPALLVEPRKSAQRAAGPSATAALDRGIHRRPSSSSLGGGPGSDCLSPGCSIRLDDDYVLTHISIAWFTNTAGSSARLAYEAAHSAPPQEPTTVPLGLAGFAGDYSGVRRFAERDHANIVQWNQYPELGGHYATHLEPEIMRDDIRGFFRAFG